MMLGATYVHIVVDDPSALPRELLCRGAPHAGIRSGHDIDATAEIFFE